MSLHAVILAGGSGTRFWPLSRAKKPKQFLPLVSERALIAETFQRVEPLCPAERIWVVYDRGDEENRRLIALAPGRKTFLFDEAQRKMYRYDPTQSP